ncbi:hypothetical protein [Burkholderia seminalis]|uniref:hypothetical protein n=1 Tax=Burkholderia seminalis TaxID=488731 RepID=UPI0026543114|nr:hypothetical protein [Burkholderia seminalis]MDN7592141.1 hypothetical protein [Burkholderia seminalis]
MTKDRDCSAGIGDLKRLAGSLSRPAIETPSKRAKFGVLALVAVASVIGAIILMAIFIDVLVGYLTSTDPVRH